MSGKCVIDHSLEELSGCITYDLCLVTWLTDYLCWQGVSRLQDAQP
jgi:hypothetical protein